MFYASFWYAFIPDSTLRSNLSPWNWLGSAIYISELAPARAQRPLVFLTELLAAIPSIVYGLWGMFLLVPWVRQLQTMTPEWMKARRSWRPTRR